MKIQRTLPPASAVVNFKKLYHGLLGSLSGSNYQGRLEEEIKEYFGVKHVFFVSSGKAALYLILKALQELSPCKNKVIVPAYTCFSVPSAIIKAGLKVTLCDIDPQTFDFDYGLLEKTMDKDTLCVIPTHLFGIPADMDRVIKLCRDKGIFVLEDAAQAMGGSYIGKLLGTIGDVGFFSLGRGKNITCGSGGIIVTNSDIIADTIKREYLFLKQPCLLEDIKELFLMVVLYIFSNPLLYWLPSGLPFLGLGETIFYKDFSVKKMSGIKAGLLRYWQEELDYSNKARRENGLYLSNELRIEKNISTTYLRFPVLMKNSLAKTRAYSLSKERGLGISCMYPTPTNEIEEIKEQFSDRLFPSAKLVSDRLITIPTHHVVSEKDMENASDLVRNLS